MMMAVLEHLEPNRRPLRFPHLSLLDLATCRCTRFKKRTSKKSREEEQLLLYARRTALQ